MPKAERGYAYFTKDSPYRPAEPWAKMVAGLGRLLGETPDGYLQAIRSAFSPHVVARLTEEFSEVKRAYEQNPGLRATSLLEPLEQIRTDMGGGRERVTEAMVSSTYATTVLANVLGRRFLQAYAEADYGEFTIARRDRAESLRSQAIVDVDRVADPPTVDPESANYVEMATLAGRSAAFSMVQKGNVLSISRKTLTNNDVGLIARVVSDWGRATRRMVARAIWNLWITNAVYAGDSVAWFDAAHANTATTALSEAAVIAALAQLRAQTTAGSGEKLGIPVRPGRVYLDVPDALADAALKLNQTIGSSLFHFFGAANEFVNVCPLFTDATDWGLHRRSEDVESVRVSYLLGREDPEVMIADLPNADQLFIGDRLQYKMRLELGLAVADPRGATKNVVAG